ncbi:hypothetical protein Tco_0504968 [Tanacetum coccineum]
MTTPRPTPFPATTPHHTPALYDYPLDSGDDLLDKGLSETAESLHTQTATTSVVYPPPTRSLPTSHVLASQPGKEIPMPLGYKSAMNRWRAAPLFTWYPLLSLELPSSSCKRSRPLLPSVPPSPEHIESAGDNIEASIWDLEKHIGP